MDQRNYNRRDLDFASRHENSRLAKLEAMYPDPVDRCRMTPHAAGRDASYNIHYSIYGQRHPFLADMVGSFEHGRQFARQFQKNRKDDWRDALGRARQNPKNQSKFQQYVVAGLLYMPSRITGSTARLAMPIDNMARQWNRSPQNEAQMAQTRQYMDMTWDNRDM